MSKTVKNMLVDDLKSRLSDVGDLVVVSLGTLNAQKTTQLRQALRKKKIHLTMVKNSLARRATLSTPLAPAFEKTEGMLAIAWGGEDVVDLVKELDRLTALKGFESLEFRGGALDGSRLEAVEMKTVAKWPTRTEQLSIISGQIISVASVLAGQIGSVGGLLAGQIASRVKELEKNAIPANGETAVVDALPAESTVA